MSYKIVYTKQVHNSLEGVRGKAEEEGKFMVLREMESLNAIEEGNKKVDEQVKGISSDVKKQNNK